MQRSILVFVFLLCIVGVLIILLTGLSIVWRVICVVLLGMVLVASAFAIERFSREQHQINAELEAENARLQKQVNAYNHAQTRIAQEREQEEKKVAEETRKQEEQKKLTRSYKSKLQADVTLFSTEGIVKTYQRGLLNDLELNKVKILEMPRQLDLSNVYVRLRLYQQRSNATGLPVELIGAEATQDPLQLLRASKNWLERRVNNAIEPESALHTYRKCVIVGDPGAGKTTLLKYLTLRAASEQSSSLPSGILPIHVGLNAYVNSHYSNLFDFIISQWEKYEISDLQARPLIEQYLREGKVLLLLDALDETLKGKTLAVAENSYMTVHRAITTFVNNYPSIYVAVTSRAAGYRARLPLSGFTELEVLEFRPQDTAAFIDNWFRDVSQKSQAEELKRELSAKPRIEALASNPLLLALIAILYQKKGCLPDRRAHLYERCVDLLIEQWDEDVSHKPERRRVRSVDSKNIKSYLARIAHRFHHDGKRFFEEGEVLTIIESEIGVLRGNIRGIKEEAYNVLSEITVETGLLKKLSEAEDLYSFLHLTIQEYLVALALKDDTDAGILGDLLTHREEPWWEEVILLYAGLVTDASKLLQALLAEEETKEGQLFYSELILAGRCLAARPSVKIISLRDEVIARLFTALQTTPYSLTRQRIVEVLIEIGDESTSENTLVSEVLLRLLLDHTTMHSVKMSIAQAYQAYASDESVRQFPALISNVYISVEVRMLLAKVLGLSNKRFVVPDLLPILVNRHLEEDVKVSVATTLGELGDPSSAEKLVVLLSNKQVGPAVRCEIATTLGILGEKRVIPELLSLYDSKIPFSLQWHIALALCALGDTSKLSDLLLLIANEKYGKEARYTIVDTIAVLRLLAVLRELLNLLPNNEVHWEVRARIALSIGVIGDETDISFLLDVLFNEKINPYVRTGTATALAHLGNKKQSDMLKSKLAQTSQEPIVHRSIVTTLVQFGTKEPALLVELLQWIEQRDININERIAMLEALRTQEDTPTTPLIGPLLALVSNVKLEPDIHRYGIQVLAELTRNESDLQRVWDTLHPLLTNHQLTDTIHHALWSIHLRQVARMKASTNRTPLVSS